MSVITHLCSCFGKRFRKKASVLCNKHDIKILPPSVHSHLPVQLTVTSLCAACDLSLSAVMYKETGHGILI